MARIIGTHDGGFHCDEVLGCWMLKTMPGFKEAKILRTRDETALQQADIILDVGGVYNPETLRFDHHQKGFHEVFSSSYSIKLSSAGLIYKHYGKEIIKNVIWPIDLSSIDLETIYQKVYKGFVMAIDAVDNGVSICGEKCEPRYSDATGLGSRVSRLNPSWNATDPNITQDSQFYKAMDVCGEDFTSYVLLAATSWLPARTYVQSALADRYGVSSTGEIIVLERPCPWKEHLFDLETEQGISGTIKYCIYGENNKAGYRIQAVPNAPDSFQSRLPLPDMWRALRFKELDEASGIQGCVFVHANGFIGGHANKEGALEMAEKALALAASSG